MPEAIGRATGGAHAGGLGEDVGLASSERDGDGEGWKATGALLHATAQRSMSAGHVAPFS
jgi:hypothetical protein